MTESYEVTYVYGNGDEDRTITVTQGSMLNKPTDPVREGYTFAGWFVGDEEYAFGTPVKSDLIITAHWTPVATYTVSFETDGDPNVQSVKVNTGGSMILPDADRDGFVLKGWQNGDELLQPGQEFIPTGDVTLTAVWEAVPSEDVDDGGSDWWVYAVVVFVIIALIALVLILHFRVGVI